jgi:hypothetical protein
MNEAMTQEWLRCPRQTIPDKNPHVRSQSTDVLNQSTSVLGKSADKLDQSTFSEEINLYQT